MLIIPQVKPQYSVLRLLLPLEKLPELGVRLLMIITNALFFKSNEGAGINNIPQSILVFFESAILILIFFLKKKKKNASFQLKSSLVFLLISNLTNGLLGTCLPQ